MTARSLLASTFTWILGLFTVSGAIAADLPTGPSPGVPSGGKAPGDYPNFTVSGVNWTMDASAVPDITSALKDEVTMALAGQGPLPWSLTEFGQGLYAPRLNNGDPQAAASNLNTLPFDLILDGTAYQWENDIDPWAANAAAWRPAPTKGVLLATVRKNGQVWNDGEPLFHGTLSVPLTLSGGEGYSMDDGSFGAGDMEVAIGKAGPDLRGSLDTSVAWFPYDQGWIGGHVASADFEQGEWIRDDYRHPDLPTDPAELITWSRFFGVIVPPVTVELPGVNSRTDGMLFTISNEGSATGTRITAVDPKADGAGWDVMIRTDDEPDPSYQGEFALAFSFLYVPYESTRLIGAHVRGSDGNILNGRGNYQVDRLSAGRYELTIPGKQSSDGMLILGAAGRIPGRSDLLSRSFLSYEPSENDTFIIESRYFESETSQPLEDSDFYFAWVDFATPLSPPGFEAVIEPPVIAESPTSQAIELGASITLSVVATGAEPFIYQWTRNGNAIPNATEPTLMISGASLTDAGDYAVEVTNAGGKTTSGVATLKVLAPPNLTQQPASVDAATGDTVRFAVSASGTPPLTYQWQKDGVDLLGASSAELVLSSISLEDAGQYRAVVSNEVRSEISTSARLTVRATLVAPTISTHPQSIDLVAGSNLELSVVAGGSAPLLYQWQRDNQDLPGQTGSSLLIAEAQESDAGLYRVVVSNTVGSITSNPATVSVTAPPPTVDPPNIVQQPVGAELEVGQAFRLQVFASGSTLQYQWIKDGSPIPGATQAAFSIASVALADAGVYSVEIANAGGTVRSLGVTLVVNSGSPPADTLTIITPPQSQTVPPGSDVTFSVVAQGDGQISYQWQLGTFNIPGARSSSFTIANVQVVDEGSYRVVVNDGTTELVSPPAVLTVSTAPTVITAPSSQSITAGDPVTFSVEAQGQAPLNYQWQFNGTNIPGARSAQFSLPEVQAADAGEYQVIVSDSGGSTTSPPAILTVTERPSTPDLVIDSITATGTTLTIRWQGSPGVVLQAAVSLTNPQWQDVPGTDGQSSAQQLALGLTAYFRLVQR